MNKVWEKYGKLIIVVLAIVAFVAVSVLLQNAGKKECVVSDEINEWVEVTKEDEYIVTVLAQTTCSHCLNYKPIFSDVIEQYGIKNYWFEVNTMEECDYNALIDTYGLKEYGGTPHTFITKAGKLVAELSGETDEEGLIEFLKENKVIKK